MKFDIWKTGPTPTQRDVDTRKKREAEEKAAKLASKQPVHGRPGWFTQNGKLIYEPFMDPAYRADIQRREREEAAQKAKLRASLVADIDGWADEALARMPVKAYMGARGGGKKRTWDDVVDAYEDMQAELMNCRCVVEPETTIEILLCTATGIDLDRIAGPLGFARLPGAADQIFRDAILRYLHQHRLFSGLHQ